jgi:biopolymer transport protein ExbB/TolQ
MLIDQLKRLFLDVPAAWVLWVLLGLLAVGLALVAERAVFFRSVSADIRKLSAELDRLLRARKYAEAVQWLSASRSPAAAIALAGLRHADLGPTAAEKAMVGATALERTRLGRGLAFLGTVGNNAPFVGLLGTVIGIIGAFEALGRNGVDPANGGSVAIMTGVAEALVATGVGLTVAIPCVASFNFFQRRIQTELASSEALSNLLLAHLHAEPVATEQPEPELRAAAS